MAISLPRFFIALVASITLSAFTAQAKDYYAPGPEEAEAGPHIGGARSAHQFGLGVRTGYLNGLVGGGAEGTYSLSRQTQLSLFAGSGKARLKRAYVTDTDATIIEPSVTGSMAHLGAKFFLSNTFHLSVGLGHRRWESSIDVENRQGNRVEQTTTVQGPYSLAAIGNTWSWRSGFYFGVDWVGLAFPFANQIDSNAKTTGKAGSKRQELEKEADDLSDLIADMPMLSTLVIHTGFQF